MSETSKLEHRLTNEQRAFVEGVLPEQGLAVVQAYAGCGKTSTLAAYIASRPKTSFLYLAFNKAMAVEANVKFKKLNFKNVIAKTMHSIAYSHFGAQHKDRLGNTRPSDFLPIVKKYFSYTNSQNSNTLTWLIQAQLNKFMSSRAHKPSLCFMENIHTDRQAQNTLDKIQHSPEKIAHVLDIAWTAIITGDTSFGPALPFPHNAYLKLMQLHPIPLSFETILIDEAQDVTPCMIDIVMHQRAAKVFIGDSYQQIYSWNGAVNSLNAVIHMGAATYYLTQSFRCPEEIAALANPYLQLLGATKNYRGSNVEIQDSPSYIAHIYRGNAGVFSYALSEMKNCQPVHYLGGFQNYNFWELVDIAYMALGKPDKIKDNFFKQFEDMEDFREYAENTKDISLEGKIKIVERYGANAIPGLYWGLKEHSASLEESTSLLTTGHKSKGQEWCYTALGSDFISISGIIEKIQTGQVKPEDLPYEISQEEIRLLYVAITRNYRKIAIPEALILSEEDRTTFADLVNKKIITLT